jgi:hypothetical protein
MIKAAAARPACPAVVVARSPAAETDCDGDGSVNGVKSCELLSEELRMDDSRSGRRWLLGVFVFVFVEPDDDDDVRAVAAAAELPESSVPRRLWKDDAAADAAAADVGSTTAKGRSWSSSSMVLQYSASWE